MKGKCTSIALIAMVMLGLATGLSTSTMGAGPNGGGVPKLTDDEKEDLLFVREEEKLARDVYDYLYAEFGHQIFSTIYWSEQNHMNMVKDLLVKYGLEDPAEGKDPGEFVNPILQEIYDDLILASSDQEAFEAGVDIEETDIADLTFRLSRANKNDIIKVYTNLRAGSENHLDAFNSHLE